MSIMRDSVRRVMPGRMFASLVAVSLPVALLLASCDDDGTGPSKTKGTYLPLNSPANGVANLAEAYRHRELEPYLEILAPEFVYKFQTNDYDIVPKGFWTYAEDSLGTGALLEASLVDDIRLELAGLQAEPSQEAGHPAGAVKVHILSVDLQVDQTDGITWLASDDQDMFFRRGLASAGEDTTRWLLFEWRDLEIGGSAAPGGSSRAGRPLVEVTTWGLIKTLYTD